MTVKKGQEVDLTIESLAYGGKGIARIDDFVIFVKNAKDYFIVNNWNPRRQHHHTLALLVLRPVP